MRILTLLLSILASNSAFADYPRPWQVYFQEPATEVMKHIIELHDFIMIILLVVLFIVLALLTYTGIRFYHKNNAKPDKFSHNIVAEVTWTIIPVIILCVIAVHSFKLLI